MVRTALQIPDEYTAALCARFEFDLSGQSLATRIGKAYIARKAEIVSRIGEGLTRNRTDFLASGYLRNKEIREAYMLYYMTTNLLKVISPLRELSVSHFFEQHSPLRILDLGTGTGSAIWGLVSFFLSENIQYPGEIVFTDSLAENLLEAENFSRYFFQQFPGASPHLTFEKFDLRKPDEIPEKIKASKPYHLIMMMNVVNELDEADDGRLMEMLMSLLDENGAAMIIEPATRAESRRLLRFRDLAVKFGATVYSPCTRQEGCPALIKGDDWCHTEVAWERPGFIKAIDELTGMLRLSLKYTYFILRKDGITLSDSMTQNNLYRIVSERFDEKGRVRAYLCGQNGRYEHIINKRDISETNRDFAEIKRYDVVRLEGSQVREHDIRIPKDAKFSIMLPI